jgi:hypothetical protein
MSENPFDEAMRRKLADLERRINEAKSSLPSHAEIGGDARKDWDDMLSRHDAIRRKLASGKQSAETLEGLRLDVDVLRHSFDKWMAHVEQGFAKSRGPKDGSGA